MGHLASHDQVYQAFLSEIDAAAVADGLALSHWTEVCRQIQHDARTCDRFEFLRWPSLNDFSVPEAWIQPTWYTTLREDPHWSTRWFSLTRDTKIGRPKDFSADFGTSPILISHAYHLLRYETATGHSLVDCDIIFEVGGGYGSFCRLLKNAGFTGLHIIYDLPHIAAIQRLYLRASGYDEVPQAEGSPRDNHAFCLVSDATLSSTFETLAACNLRIGLVATWSLSEFPLGAREQVMPRFLGICCRYLIAYQPYFCGIDNNTYFDTLRKLHPELGWQKEDIPPSYYLLA